MSEEDKKIHVKDGATHNRALCFYSSGSMTWTSRTSAKVIATCPECLTEVLMDTCSVCDGAGEIDGGGCRDTECCGKQKCYHCDGDEFLSKRDASSKQL